VKVYRVTYWKGHGLTTTVTVPARSAQEAREEAQRRDPKYIVNAKPPRIVGEQEVNRS
jgi:hypothetical protein